MVVCWWFDYSHLMLQNPYRNRYRNRYRTVGRSLVAVFMSCAVLTGCGPKKQNEQPPPSENKADFSQKNDGPLADKLKSFYSVAELRCEAFVSESEVVTGEGMPLDSLTFNLLEGEMKKTDRQTLTVSSGAVGRSQTAQFQLSQFKLIEIPMAAAAESKKVRPLFEIVIGGMAVDTDQTDKTKVSTVSQVIDWKIKSNEVAPVRQLGQTIEIKSAADAATPLKSIFSYLYRCGLNLKVKD